MLKLFAFLLIGLSGPNDDLESIKHEYESIRGPKPQWEVYVHALRGYEKIKHDRALNGGKEYITIIDFDLPSDQKRMWIIDLKKDSTLVHTYVSHGRNSGEKKAVKFSNKPSSFQSSLGFYLTDVTYRGRNGYSLRLDGLERGINDNARSRAIVMHGAPYAEEAFIKKTGRLGRSHGCPAVPASLHQSIINLVKDKTVLYIHHKSEFYTKNSLFVTP